VLLLMKNSTIIHEVSDPDHHKLKSKGQPEL